MSRLKVDMASAAVDTNRSRRLSWKVVAEGVPTAAGGGGGAECRSTLRQGYGSGGWDVACRGPEDSGGGGRGGRTRRPVGRRGNWGWGGHCGNARGMRLRGEAVKWKRGVATASASIIIAGWGRGHGCLVEGLSDRSFKVALGQALRSLRHRPFYRRVDLLRAYTFGCLDPAMASCTNADTSSVDIASSRMESADWSAKAAATDLCTSASMACASGAGVGVDSSPQAANASKTTDCQREDCQKLGHHSRSLGCLIGLAHTDGRKKGKVPIRRKAACCHIVGACSGQPSSS